MGSSAPQAQREARGVWQRRGRHRRRQGDREVRHKKRLSQSQGGDCRLWGSELMQPFCRTRRKPASSTNLCLLSLFSVQTFVPSGLPSL